MCAYYACLIMSAQLNNAWWVTFRNGIFSCNKRCTMSQGSMQWCHGHTPFREVWTHTFFPACFWQCAQCISSRTGNNLLNNNVCWYSLLHTWFPCHVYRCAYYTITFSEASAHSWARLLRSAERNHNLVCTNRRVNGTQKRTEQMVDLCIKCNRVSTMLRSIMEISVGAVSYLRCVPKRNIHTLYLHPTRRCCLQVQITHFCWENE